MGFGTSFVQTHFAFPLWCSAWTGSDNSKPINNADIKNTVEIFIFGLTAVIFALRWFDLKNLVSISPN